MIWYVACDKYPGIIGFLVVCAVMLVADAQMVLMTHASSKERQQSQVKEIGI